jgi:hypothetical protein
MPTGDIYWTCPRCGNVMHISFMPNHVQGLCFRREFNRSPWQDSTGSNDLILKQIIARLDKLEQSVRGILEATDDN